MFRSIIKIATIIITMLLLLISCGTLTPFQKIASNSFTLAAVGDISHPSGSSYTKEFDALGAQKYSKTAYLFADAELVFANLENPYTHELPVVVKKFSFSSKPKELEYVVDSGVNLMSVANNHSADAGLGGVTDTITLLKKYQKQKKKEDPHRAFVWAGSGGSVDEARAPKVFTIPNKNIEIAFLAYGNNDSKYVNTFHTGTAVSDIRRIRRNYPDAIIIVSVHSGTEYIHIPSRDTQKSYHKLIDAGAQLILGHHPHVAQGIEHYNEGLICYSFGNYSFGSRTIRYLEKNAKMYSMLNTFNFLKKGDRLMVNLKVYPLYTNNGRSMTIGTETTPQADFIPYIPSKTFSQEILRSFITWSNALPDNKIIFQQYHNYITTNITLKM